MRLGNARKLVEEAQREGADVEQLVAEHANVFDAARRSGHRRSLDRRRLDDRERSGHRRGLDNPTFAKLLLGAGDREAVSVEELFDLEEGVDVAARIDALPARRLLRAHRAELRLPVAKDVRL